jgi:putative ABC transport system permease protein
MGYLHELLSEVASSLFRNKLRSFLTMAGIAWGVASIVLIVAMGDGFKQGQRNNTKQLGENIVLLFPGRTEKQVGGQRAGRQIRFNYDDIDDIRTECYLVSRVIGELQNGAKVASAYNSGSFTVNGVEPLYSKIRTIPIAQGRFLIEPDETGGAACSRTGRQCPQAVVWRSVDRARIADLPEWLAISHRGTDAGQEPEQQLQRAGRR